MSKKIEALLGDKKINIHIRVGMNIVGFKGEVLTTPYTHTVIVDGVPISYPVYVTKNRGKVYLFTEQHRMGSESNWMSLLNPTVI